MPWLPLICSVARSCLPLGFITGVTAKISTKDTGKWGDTLDKKPSVLVSLLPWRTLRVSLLLPSAQCHKSS